MIKSRIGFCDLHLIFKVTARLNPPNLSQKVFVCMLRTIGWNVTKFASLYKSDRIDSLFSFCWPWPNFQGHSFMTEIATVDWFGRWGTSVFSENTAIFSASADSSRAVTVVSYWRKYGHFVLVNHLGSLPRNSVHLVLTNHLGNLPRNCVDRLTDRLNMTLIVLTGLKT